MMTANKVDQEHSLIIISFEFVVEWDAWYFVTASASPDCDPVKFLCSHLTVKPLKMQSGNR